MEANQNMLAGQLQLKAINCNLSDRRIQNPPVGYDPRGNVSLLKVHTEALRLPKRCPDIGHELHMARHLCVCPGILPLLSFLRVDWTHKDHALWGSPVISCHCWHSLPAQPIVENRAACLTLHLCGGQRLSVGACKLAVL